MENESDWLVQAAAGDELAFARIVENYQKPVFNLCYRMLGNPGDAEDAAQETFMRAYKYLDRYDSNRPFATWLLSIASHYCIDQLRRKKFQGFSMDDEERDWLEPPATGTNPEIAVSNNEKQSQVQELLALLNPKDRSIVVMRYWYDYSYQEIADALSITVSAVKSRLHRSRRELALGWQSRRAENHIAERICHESPAF
jgi:RNA polymerase sigma-70 factor (ECF subfamily)